MRFAAPGVKPPVDPPPSPPQPPAVHKKLPLSKIALGGAVGLALLISGAALALLLRPLPSIPPEAFNKAVEAYLQKRTPDPTAANIAFAVVQPSLVLIKVEQPRSKLQGVIGLGAGVVVEENGTIMTCLHVIEGGSGIRIVFADGFETGGKVLRTVPENDLAILVPEVVPEDLVPATFGDSTDLNIGDPVVAVGNPFGLVDSVSEGVVSGLGRTATAKEGGPRLSNLIQFDAAVNPGNSGGPLLNRRGEVVGLVTALLNPTKESFFIGVGYAITIESAGRALDIPPW